MPQFNDEFVKAHYSANFSSADDMKKALLAETAMMRVKDMDKQLEDTVLEVSYVLHFSLHSTSI